MHHRNRFEPVVRTYLYEIRYVLLGMHLNFFQYMLFGTQYDNSATCHNSNQRKMEQYIMLITSCLVTYQNYFMVNICMRKRNIDKQLLDKILSTCISSIFAFIQNSMKSFEMFSQSIQGIDFQLTNSTLENHGNVGIKTQLRNNRFFQSKIFFIFRRHFCRSFKIFLNTISDSC